MLEALQTAGNPDRRHELRLSHAARLVYGTREALAAGYGRFSMSARGCGSQVWALGCGGFWSREWRPLHARETALACLFYEQVRSPADVINALWRFCGTGRAPYYGICVRAGAHCAPLMHKVFRDRRAEGCGAVQLFTHEHRAGSAAGRGCGPPAGAGGIRCVQNGLISSFHSMRPWKPWLGKALHGSQYPGRLIPLPRELSAGCGLAWRMLPGDWQQWQSKLDRNAF